MTQSLKIRIRDLFPELPADTDIIFDPLQPARTISSPHFQSFQQLFHIPGIFIVPDIVWQFDHKKNPPQ